MQKYNGFSIDIEANGFVFEVDTIWVINLEDLDTSEKLQLHPFKDKNAKRKLLEWVDKYDCPNIAFHNGLGYDIFALHFILGIEFNVLPDTFAGRNVNFADTFYLSMFLNPDREKHSIEYFGNKLGKNKIDFRQKLIDVGALNEGAEDGAEFLKYHPIMDEYCERDTLVGKLTFISLINEWKEIYGSFDGFTTAYKSGQKAFYLMACQELTGWKFDTGLAKELTVKIEGMMEEIRCEVEPLLPPRKLKKTEEKEYKMPAKPYKKDGSLSSHMEKWIEKHSAKLVDNKTVEVYGKTVSIEAGKVLDIELPMQMANQDQMKDWFLSLGWEPSFWNYKRDEMGKPWRDPVTRQLVETTPKIQEAGKLCPNLEKLEGDLVKKVVKWLSLRNRQSVLNGWLSNPRLPYDGRIGAARTGIAATHRQKHRVLVNVPKASEKVLLGKEFRSLFTSEDGFFIAAGDAAALEGRVQGHYTWKYDNGATAKELLEGDIHSKTAKSVYADELKDFDITSEDFNKDDPKFKPYRDRSKNVFYACLPMKTKVLTKTGWKFFNEISEGEELPTYNESSGNIEMDTVIHKHFFNDKSVVKFSNKRDSFECTEDHRWYGWRRSKTKGKPSKKVYGYFQADRFTQEHNIVLTAPWVGNPVSNLSDDDCALLGWLAPDGYWKWSDKKEVTSCSGGKNKGIHASIAQADSKFWKEIESLLKRIGAEYWLNRKEVENGNTVNTYTLKPRWIRKFLDRIFNGRKNKHDIDWTSLIMTMTRSNLESFYNAFYMGDGCTKGDSEVISQNLGNIFDAVVASAQLLGNGRVSLQKRTDAPNPMKSICVQKVKHITCQEIKKEDIGIQDTFCLTTGNGSFIIWQDDFIGITGNCLYGAGDSKLAKTAGLPEAKGKAVSEKFWSANAATKQLKDNLEKYWEKSGRKKYLPAIDGRILNTRKKSALLNTIFQSCGGITMDYAGLFLDKWLGGIKFDSKRRPYYDYNGKIVRRIGYFHDEYEFECEGEDTANKVAKLIEKAIASAGKYLKLNVELAGEGKVGKNWKEVH